MYQILNPIRSMFRRSPVFEDALTSWFAVIRHQKKAPEVIAQMRRDALKRWRYRTLASLTKAEVIAAVEEVAAARGPSSAAHLLSYCGRFFRWCVARDLLGRSPLEGLTAKAIVGTFKPRQRTLSHDELAAIWHATAVPTDFARIVRLLMLSGARRTEISALHGREIDRAERLIRLRQKGDKVHLIPITDAMLPCLPPRKGYLYGRSRGGGFSGWSRAKALLDARCGVTGWCLHDVRRTVRSELSRLRVPREVAEAVLGHAPPALVGTYDVWSFLPERRETLALWSEELRRITEA